MTLGKLFNISETEFPPTDHLDNVQLAGLFRQSNEKTCKAFQESDWLKKCSLLFHTHVCALPTSEGTHVLRGISNVGAWWMLPWPTVGPPTHPPMPSPVGLSSNSVSASLSPRGVELSLGQVHPAGVNPCVRPSWPHFLVRISLPPLRLRHLNNPGPHFTPFQPYWTLQFSQHIMYFQAGGMLCSAAQLCLTLCDPMDCNLPGSSAHWTFQARILEWGAISYSRGSFPPRDRTHFSYIFCIGRQVLYHCVAWETLIFALRPA